MRADIIETDKLRFIYKANNNKNLPAIVKFGDRFCESIDKVLLYGIMHPLVHKIA